MPWDSAFYFGASQTVFVPIDTIEFDAVDLSEFSVEQDQPIFGYTPDQPVFDFIGEPKFEPIGEGADFNVQC